MVGIIRHQYLGNDSTFKTSANARLSLPVAVTPDTNSDEVDGNDYRFEVARRDHFENWPISYIAPEKLAAAGFYYTGEGDKMTCFECQAEICNSVEGDIPMVDHQRWSGTCRFIRKINCGNVPIEVDPDTVIPPSGRDECSPYGLIYRSTSGPDNHNFSIELQAPSNQAVEPSCLSLAGTGKKGVHPEYASYEARLRTFAT
jgi:baculoviral IAP repeat-containing protein 7/8